MADYAAPSPIVVQKLGLGGAELPAFPARGAPVGDTFAGSGVLLRPLASPSAAALGPEGRLPTAPGDAAQGLWRGTVEGVADDEAPLAASRVAPLLAGTEGALGLDCRGTLASTKVEAEALRFLPKEVREAEAAEVVAALGLPAGQQAAIRCFRLSGRSGQVLSHAADLWLAPKAAPGGGLELEGFEALLRLVPRPRHGASGGAGAAGGTGRGEMRIARHGPFGAVHESWVEVPMIEHPNLLRLMMGSATEASQPQEFLVEEAEEILVFHCWQRLQEAAAPEAPSGVVAAPGPTAAEDDAAGGLAALSHEQVLWLDVVAALAETAPCGDVPVPAARVRLAPEGLATRAELLGDTGVDPGSVASEDAPRLASLHFLRQYVQPHILEEEVWPRLLPAGGGSAATVRVFSAELAPASATAEVASVPAGSQRRPKTLDDLFQEDMDFRAPLPWAASDAPPEEDPLKLHELTSVLLLNETSGFAIAFHCLQAIDPCST